jgi:hypothetical protein
MTDGAVDRQPLMFFVADDLANATLRSDISLCQKVMQVFSCPVFIATCHECTACVSALIEAALARLRAPMVRAFGT